MDMGQAAGLCSVGVHKWNCLGWRVTHNLSAEAKGP